MHVGIVSAVKGLRLLKAIQLHNHCFIICGVCCVVGYPPQNDDDDGLVNQQDDSDDDEGPLAVETHYG